MIIDWDGICELHHKSPYDSFCYKVFMMKFAFALPLGIKSTVALR